MTELARVLVVDDFADARDLYAETLRALGYAIETAENGEEAIAKARAWAPAVIVMDLAMPVLDGWEATRILKRDDATKSICIIALTGHAQRHHHDLAKEAGADFVVFKPCLPEQLAKFIDLCLAR